MSNPVELLRRVENPLLTTSDFIRWQLEAFTIMESNRRLTKKRIARKITDPDSEKKLQPIPNLGKKWIAPTTIHLVHDGEGGTGRTTFLGALVDHDVDQYIIFHGIPEHRAYQAHMEFLKRMNSVCRCIIFDIPRGFDEDPDEIQHTIELASDHPQCTNVWIFTSTMLNLSRVSQKRWKLFSISADWQKGMMSGLIPMTFLEAQKLFISEQKSRSWLEMED